MQGTSLIASLCVFILLGPICLHAQMITWQGHHWAVTDGGMAGVAPGNPANVSIDSHGYLHLRIVNRKGRWTASELFTTDNLGFGTYQWVVQGNVFNLDKSTVLGLFPYGPAHHIGVDGENEIDIEFSKWNDTCGGCNADFTVYPSTGNRKPNGDPSWEDNFHASGGTMTTARTEWRSDGIVLTIIKGVQPIGTTANVIKQETFKSNAKNIPQDAIPVGINLWCFQKTPAKDQSVVVREFQFVPQ